MMMMMMMMSQLLSLACFLLASSVFCGSFRTELFNDLSHLCYHFLQKLWSVFTRATRSTARTCYGNVAGWVAGCHMPVLCLYG